jgi:hypothetical protein
MQFVFPAFLFALGALAIPVIIHLFYFRRFKRIYFTNVRFLKEVKEETSNRRKLRNILVLLMRCLAFAFLVLGFAQPFIPRSTAVKKGEKSVSIFIDNSFSMNALSKEAPLLELGKKRAREIVSAFAPDDRFQILTNDFEGRDQRLVGKDDALNRIEEIRISPASRELSKVLLRQEQCLSTSKAANKLAYQISDFQQNIADLEHFRDTLLDIYLVPIRAVQENNISIDSAWFESPVQILNQPANLLVKISNRGNENAEEVRLSLRHDGQAKPVGTLKIAAHASKIDTVSFNILHAGWHEAKLALTDYPVQFDDDYYVSFHVAERVKVLCINGLQQNKYLNNAFIGARYFRLDNADARSLDYSKFEDYQLIVLNEIGNISSGLAQELKTFAQNGGNILVFPPQNADLNAYNAFLQGFNAGNLGPFESAQRQASQINTEEFVFHDVYQNKSANLRLPATQGNFKIAPNRGEYVLTYRDGSAMMAKYAYGEGALYFSAAPIDDKISDMVRNGEIFVPMLFKMAIAGSKGRQIAYTIGKDEVLEANHQVSALGETTYKLKKQPDNEQPTPESDQNVEFIPAQRILGAKVLLTPGTALRDAGWYRLSLRPDSTLSDYAFNYDRKESELKYRTAEEMKDVMGKNVRVLDENAEANFGQVVGEQNQGIVLWRWCVIFALLFLALEVLFLRLWKV